MTGKVADEETCCFGDSLKTKAMPLPFALGQPEERRKERAEYPGGTRSAILASSPAGRSHVPISSAMSMLLPRMNVEMSYLFLDVPTDLAPKEADQECVFSRGGTKGNAKQLPVRWTHRIAERKDREVFLVEGWVQGCHGLLMFVRVRKGTRTETREKSGLAARDWEVDPENRRSL